ncbi:MAG TPA: hypothetical protein VGS80_04105 [Ktedonobacterales bacterium]|nr:hypothetical protein [Ktedonobacterales bacterium]
MPNEPDRTPTTPFERGWWSFDLSTYRPCDSTYCLFDSDRLPPLPPLDDTLSWLGPLPDAEDQQMEPRTRAPGRPIDAQDALQLVVGEAEQLGLTLPESFLRLMSSRALQQHIPSCTACEFELAYGFLPCPSSPGGYILEFLHDQQYCVVWYLYLTSGGEQCVLASTSDLYAADDEEQGEDADLEALDEDEERDEPADPEALARTIRVCAPSFTAFIYRFWLENVLWSKLYHDDKTPLTLAEQSYLDHYRQPI